MQNDPGIGEISAAADLALARTIRQQVFVDEQGIPAELEEDGLNENAIHVLLTLQGQAVGTARMHITDDNEGEIARVAIVENFRGKGYGRALVAELELIALRRNLKRLLLHPHHYLEKFYADIGFTVVPGKTERAGEHLLITMEKILS